MSTGLIKIDKPERPEFGPPRNKNTGKGWEGWLGGRKMKTLGPKGFGALPKKRGKVMKTDGDISNLISATFQCFLEYIFQDGKKH